jgi:hypothetical protein
MVKGRGSMSAGGTAGPLKDGMSNEEIIETVKDIRRQLNNCFGNVSIFNQTKQKLKQDYANFASRYEMLFEISCEPSFSWDNFDIMMKMRERLIDNEKSFDEASKEIGQIFFDKYVDTKTKK